MLKQFLSRRGAPGGDAEGDSDSGDSDPAAVRAKRARAEPTARAAGVEGEVSEEERKKKAAEEEKRKVEEEEEERARVKEVRGASGRQALSTR